MSDDPKTLGQRLKAERERRGMSMQKIANGMHLDEWVIDALEAGDYQRIGPPVYAQGHLRKYASLLGVLPGGPGADAAPGTDAAPTGHAYPPPIVRLDTPPESRGTWPRIGAVSSAILLAGVFFWWRAGHQNSPARVVSSSVPSQTAATPMRTAGEEASDSADEDLPDTNAAPALAENAESAVRSAIPATPPAVSGVPAASGVSAASGVFAAPGVSAVPGVPAAPPGPAAPAASAASVPPSGSHAPNTPDLTPGVGKARLRLSFSADSWVDIEDYSGKRVFEGNGRANSVKTIAGMAPFRVYLRSASGVQLQLNDRAVAIGRQFIVHDEARFEAGADGVLRRDSRTAPTNGPQTAAVSPHG